MSNISDHPASLLKRKVELLEQKVKLLERERDQRARVDLVLIQKYEEMKDLVTKAMKLLEQYPPKK